MGRCGLALKLRSWEPLCCGRLELPSETPVECANTSVADAAWRFRHRLQHPPTVSEVVAWRRSALKLRSDCILSGLSDYEAGTLIGKPRLT
jgi:hypothetical protein